jgi:CRISPR-associated protein Cas1
MRMCFEGGIPLTWLSRGGKVRARCLPASARTAEARIAQHAAAAAPERRLGLAKDLVRGKLSAEHRLLQEVAGNREPGSDSAAAVTDHRACLGALAAAGDLDSLRGYEGVAAAAFWRGFGAGLTDRSDLRFARRTRRPPRDPCNALLSFAGALASNMVAGLAAARGLDLAVGFLHEPRGGRPSLALDLVEEWRPAVVARFVLRVANLRMLRAEHFEGGRQAPTGVRLTANGRKVFFRAWEQFLLRPLRGADGADMPVREAMARQVDRFAQALTNHASYAPFEAR